MTKRGSEINLDPEYGVDPTYKTTREKDEDALVLMEARLNRLKNLSKEQILQTRLLQLKLKMENYLSEPNTKMGNQFGQFVDNYVQILYAKQSSFAKTFIFLPIY